MQVAMRKLDEQLFTPECHAAMLGEEGKRIAQRLNALSLPVAIIHSSELIDQKTENGRRAFRYLLTDIGVSLTVEVELTTDNKIASMILRGPLGFVRTPTP